MEASCLLSFFVYVFINSPYTHNSGYPPDARERREREQGKEPASPYFPGEIAGFIG
jgi:hypothetical protein